jgi:4-amino-4-deoxy-L-arabinose transferase-like glycosyltransferase
MTLPRFPALTIGQSIVVLVLVCWLQASYNLTLPLSGDEAYYWVWAKTLQMGYHDHPPAIAVLIAATTALVGDTVTGVRLVAVLCMAGAVFHVSLIARELFGARAATLALLLALVVPVSAAGFTLATPDSPLALFWAAGLLHGRRAVAGEGRWRDFLLAGLSIGLALDSKYTAVLLPMAVVGFVLWRRRDLLTSPRSWAAVLAAAAAFAPVVWWNVAHGLESFAFQYQHGGAKLEAPQWGWLGEFIGSQFLILSPLLLVMLGFCVARWRDWWRDDGRVFLVACFLLPALFFLYKALFAKMQMNWAVPIYLSALPLLADFILARGLKRTTALAILLALALSAAFKWPLAFGLTGKLNPHNRLHGPDVAVAAIEQLRRPGDSLFADHLQRASLMRFLLPDHPRVFIPVVSRFSEYTRWDAGIDFHAMHGLYLGEVERLDNLREAFGSAELVQEVVATKRGFRTERYFIYRVGE